ncbi:MAG: hypothetical protein UW80_C0032G0001, partial [Microgenomates group bacterium GW2011_GWC1_44_9]
MMDDQGFIQPIAPAIAEPIP